MKFFRDKLHEDITIPAPPKDDMAEAKVVKKLISNRTTAQEKNRRVNEKIIHINICNVYIICNFRCRLRIQTR